MRGSGVECGRRAAGLASPFLSEFGSGVPIYGCVCDGGRDSYCVTELELPTARVAID